MMATLTFAQPAWLWALITVPMVYLSLRHLSRRNMRLRHAFTSSAASSHNVTASHITAVIWSLLLGGFILLLARPTVLSQAVNTSHQQRDILFLIDESNSMFADDLSPNRILAAKQQLTHYIHQANAQKIGLAHYAGKVKILAPMTSNKAFLQSALAQIGERQFFHGGSHLHQAIIDVIDILYDDNNHPLLVILTDGDNQEQGAQEAITAINQHAVQTLIIGLGDDETGVRIPTEQGWLTVNNQPVWSRLQHGNAEQLAAHSDYVTYLPIGLNTFSLSEILNSLTQGEHAHFTEQNTQRQPWFIPLTLLLMGGLLIQLTRSPLFCTALLIAGLSNNISPSYAAQPQDPLDQPLADVEQYQQALARARDKTTAITLHYNLATAYIHLAVAADEAMRDANNDYAQHDSTQYLSSAKASLNTVLTHQPTHPQARQNLAWIAFYENLKPVNNTPQPTANDQSNANAKTSDKEEKQSSKQQDSATETRHDKQEEKQHAIENVPKEIDIQKSENASAIVKSLMKAKTPSKTPQESLMNTW